MKTDDLITVLAADGVQGRQVGPMFLAACLGPVLIAGAGYLWIAGVRPDLIAAIQTAPMIWKWLLPAILAGSSAALALLLSRPEGRTGMLPAILILACGLVTWLFLSRLRVVPSEDWGTALRGQTLWICQVSIFGIGLPALIASLLVLRGGATSRPTLAGLSAGLACGSAAAMLYAVHCTEDDPLFFITWYGAAILTLALLGALLGRKLLKW
jgi:hypothetical protein